MNEHDTNIEKKIEEIFPDMVLTESGLLKQVIISTKEARKIIAKLIESGQLAFGISEEELAEIMYRYLSADGNASVLGIGNTIALILKKMRGE